MAKADQGSGSAALGRAAVVVAAAAVVGLLMMSQLKTVDAAVYKVGDVFGWNFNVEDWTNDKTFRVGDILEFSYNSKLHNVVVVDKDGYTNCKTPVVAKVFNSGDDRITLPKGPSYFICNFTNHCEARMKIAVNAA